MGDLFKFDYIIKGGDGEFLDTVIPEDIYERMFRGRYISVLNKGKCGNGGTTGFVEYALQHNKGCLILVPNRGIAISKGEEYKNNPEICCVYGGSDHFDNEARIVIATYDQFPRLMQSLTNYGFTQSEDIWNSEFWSGRTIIIDEYHKLVDECGFREICHEATGLIKNTDGGVVLMSATPHWRYISFIRELVNDREIVTYNIEYSRDDIAKLIQVYPANKKDLHSILKKVKDNSLDNHTCVFFNSIKGITDIIDHIGEDDCEILCSEKHENELGDYYSDTFNERKRLHFMTSAYFTGHDIKTHVKHCIIIGSKETESMCLGERDIKQMIGRFRSGVEGIHLFYLNKRVLMDKYQPIKDEFFKNTQYLEMMGENWKNTPVTIKLKQETIRLEDTLERFDYWSHKEKLIKRLENYGYIVKQKAVGEFDNVEKRKKLTFKEAKRRIAEGEQVSYDENKYAPIIQEFMNEKGADELLQASSTTIIDWNRIRKNVGVTDVELLSPEEKFKVMGLENFGRYKGSYLMACLKYLGVSCDYDQLSMKMKETFGCYASVWKNDRKSKSSGDIFIVFMKMKDWGASRKMGVQSYNEGMGHTAETGGMPHNLSYQTQIKDKNCYGRTISLDEAPKLYSSLKGINLYDWVNEDKEHRLPEVKGSDEWKIIKNFRQTKISEMFKDTDKEYRHCKASMEYIDCLIVDIDSGLNFSSFQERYKDYVWVSYPTINNIPEDWSKFRVIIPLKYRLKLSGEYSVMTLKMLRSMFCYYEDPNHQVASYINREDWMKRRGNNGELFDIPQEVVDDMMMSIKNSRDCVMLRFDKDQADSNIKSHHSTKKTLEWSKGFFMSSFELGDGERHKRLFVIKNNLDEKDRELFQSWLMSNYPSYLSHWKSHKVLSHHK